MRLSQIASNITEAFQAGRTARRKESVQDTVQGANTVQSQIETFKKLTGYQIEIKDDKPYYDGDIRFNNCDDPIILPEGLTVTGCLDLSYCTGLTSLPNGLNVNFGIYLDGCTGLTTLPDNLYVDDDLYLNNCTGLESLPQGLKVRIDLRLDNCTNLKLLPDGLTVGDGLYMDNCTKLTSLPNRLTVNSLYIQNCTGLTSLPADLTIKDQHNQGLGIIWPPKTLKAFFKKLGIKLTKGHIVTKDEWMSKRHLVNQMTEAFKAGNKARKKESAADAVESVPMDLKAAVYAWCANMKAAIKKRNVDKSIPYKADDFYLPEAIWSDLEEDNEFESEENIYLTGRGRNSRLKGSVAIDIARIDDDMVELGFCYERISDGQFAGWLLFDSDGQNYIKISASDLGSEKGVRIMTDALDRCWNMMFGDRISEAFKAGNMARKKETVADTVDGIRPDFGTAMHVWCSKVSDAMYERNGNCDWRNVPWHAIVRSGDRLIGFYSADVILDALDRKGVFEMIGDEENIEMETTRTGGQFRGNVWFTVYKGESAADGEYIDVTFGYERTDRQAWWDDPGTLKEGITLTIDDLVSDAGVEKFFAKLDECFDKMIG